MMSLDIAIMAVAACWFFWVASREYDREEAPGLPTQERPGTERSPGGAARAAERPERPHAVT
jgi:hypothetical protein